MDGYSAVSLTSRIMGGSLTPTSILDMHDTIEKEMFSKISVHQLLQHYFQQYKNASVLRKHAFVVGVASQTPLPGRLPDGKGGRSGLAK